MIFAPLDPGGKGAGGRGEFALWSLPLGPAESEAGAAPEGENPREEQPGRAGERGAHPRAGVCQGEQVIKEFPERIP